VGNDPVDLVDPFGEWWGIAFAVIDLAIQLYENGGNWKCVSWSEVGLSMVGGGLFNGLKRGAFLWRSAKFSSKLGARSAWMRRNGILGRKIGQHYHHWAVPQNMYRGNPILEHIFNQPWNINPIDGAFNRRLGGGFWKTKLGAPSWAVETLGGSSAWLGGSDGCGCK
jgi:hypothetical protein